MDLIPKKLKWYTCPKTESDYDTFWLVDETLMYWCPLSVFCTHVMNWYPLIFFGHVMYWCPLSVFCSHAINWYPLIFSGHVMYWCPLSMFCSHLVDGDNIQIGGLKFTALFTPGHTVGHTAFLLHSPGGDCPDSVFTGDLLFLGGSGM